VICAVSVPVSPWFNALATAAWQLRRTRVLVQARHLVFGATREGDLAECFHLGGDHRQVCIALVDSLVLGTLFL